MIIMTESFSQKSSFFQDAFCRHENQNSAFSNFFNLKCVYEKLRLREGLVWTRENEGTEREAPGPALGICHVHEIYF